MYKDMLNKDPTYLTNVLEHRDKKEKGLSVLEKEPGAVKTLDENWELDIPVLYLLFQKCCEIRLHGFARKTHRCFESNSRNNGRIPLP
jgi:hypothetical protein